MTEPVRVPDEIRDRIRHLCLALPEARDHVDLSRSAGRSDADAYLVRGRTFCLLMARLRGPGRTVTFLRVRPDPEERAALIANGFPFFPSRTRDDHVAIVMTSSTDWGEIRELVTASYRHHAPKRLAELVE